MLCLLGVLRLFTVHKECGHQQNTRIQAQTEQGKREKESKLLSTEWESYIDHCCCFQFNIYFKCQKSELAIPDIVQREKEMPGALEHTVETTQAEKSELSKCCAIC